MPSRAIPPGPRGSWLFGVSPLSQGSPTEAISRWAREYGDVVSWRTAYVRVFLLNHPDDIETVLLTRSASFIKGRGFQANRQLFGNGLLTSEGSLWLRQRRLMQPAFQRERVAGSATAMLASAARAFDGWRDGEVRDVHRDFMRLALEIAATTLFGVRIESQAAEVEEAMGRLVAAGRSARRLFPVLRYLPTTANRNYVRGVRSLDRIVYGIIAQRRAEHEAGRNGRPDDLLARLLQAQDEDGTRMSNRQIRDEAITLLLAGHETTALALSWTAYLLAQHPEIQEHVHAEVDAVLGGRTPSARDLAHLPFTERVLRESLRLYPPAWVMPRMAAEDCEIHGYAIRKGVSVLVSQWVVHRDPRYYPEPLRFAPERWTESFARGLPRFAYFPFGAGPRVCIGNHFALMEAMLVLATMTLRFRLEPASADPVVPMATMTLRPQGGVPLRIARRGSALSGNPGSGLAHRNQP